MQIWRMLQILLGQDSVRIKMSEARVGQYTRCKYDACSFVPLGHDSVGINVSEARVGQYTRCKYDACSFVLLGQDSVSFEKSCPRHTHVGQDPT